MTLIITKLKTTFNSLASLILNAWRDFFAFARKLDYTKAFKILLSLLIAIPFILAICTYLLNVRSNQSRSVHLDFGGRLVPETNEIRIIVDEFTKGKFLANATVTIGRNKFLPAASASEEIILILKDITPGLPALNGFPLSQKSKSKNAAFFQTYEKIKIPMIGNSFFYPFDDYLIAVLPMYAMGGIGYNIPDKAWMAIKLPQQLRVEPLKEIKLNRPWSQPNGSNEVDCNVGCGIKDKIFIFRISHALWHKFAVIGILVCLFIPVFILLKSQQLSNASELLTLILSIAAVRTFVLGSPYGQFFALDIYFLAYFVFWLFVQLARVR